MPNYSELIPTVTNLNGGLDLANPKQAVDPGTLRNCMNVEVAERVGYKQVDGIERHDGRIGPSAVQRLELVYIQSNPVDGNITPDPAMQVGDILQMDGEDWATVVSKVDFDTNPTPVEYTTVYIFGNSPVEFNTSTVYTITNPSIVDTFSGTIKTFANDSTSALGTAIRANLVYEDVHDNILPPPQGRRAHGLHWFRDRLYGVLNMLEYPFENGAEEVFANDLIEDSEGDQAIVRNVELTSGTWSGGDAEGTIWIVTPETGSGPLSAGSISIIRPGIPDITNAFVIGPFESVDTAQKASLWRTTEQDFVLRGKQTPDGTDDYGWNPIEMGYIVPFEDGSYPLENLPTINRRNADGIETNTPLISETDPTATDAAPQTSAAGVLGDIPPYAPVNGSITWTGAVPATVESDDLSYLVLEYNPGLPTGALGSFRTGSSVLSLTEFPQVASDIPVDATIEGIEFVFQVFNDFDPGDTAANFITNVVVKPKNLTLESEIRTATIPLNATTVGSQATISVGGPEDLWGQERITQAQLADVNFGIDFQTVIEGTFNPSGGTNFDRRYNFNTIKIKVYYSVSSPKIYFWDGVDDVSGLLANYNVTSGTFPNGTAEGVLHIYDLTPEGAAVRQHINANDEIRTGPGGGGNLLANVNGAVQFATLPSLQNIVEEESRYQMITANYYANEAWDAIYGVSGAGRAWVYDQQYFRYIYTGLGDDLDKPRHIEFHIYHLALGYKSGSIFLSVVGEPEDFSGVNGAFETSTGDRITGLLSLPGGTLGIGCQRSIWGLQGQRLQDFGLQTLRPYEGCIEYTFVDMGFPIYCSNAGISIFNNTPAYGDFIGDKISYDVYPFLYPRLYKNATRGVNQRSVGIVFAMPIRRKNQYLIFFQDGYVLCMTQATRQSKPSFTFRRYRIPVLADDETESPSQYVVPIAHTVENDSLGRERVFVSHYNPEVTQSNFNGQLLFPFELDKGWSFANRFIDWNFETNFNFASNVNKSPNDLKIDRKLKMYGLSYGISHLSAAVSGTFNTPDNFLYDLSLPPPVPANGVQKTFQEDLEPYSSNTASIAQRGEFISVKIKNTSPKFTSDSVPIRRVLPPVVCQVLLQQFDSAREGV